MGSRIVTVQVDTEKPIEKVKEAAKGACKILGGTIQDTDSGFRIYQGKEGVNFAFTADFDAQVDIRTIDEAKRYELICMINWKASAIVWVCLGVGIFVFGILWIIPFFYLFVDPESAYRQALSRTSTYL